MSPKHAWLTIFGTIWHKRTREAKTEHQLIRRIKSKMKEFDKNFVESLLEGVKAKVRSIGLIAFFNLEINSLFRE